MGSRAATYAAVNAFRPPTTQRNIDAHFSGRTPPMLAAAAMLDSPAWTPNHQTRPLLVFVNTFYSPFAGADSTLFRMVPRVALTIS